MWSKIKFFVPSFVAIKFSKLGTMKKHLVFFLALVFTAIGVFAQVDTSKGIFWQPKPQVYLVKQALEFESLFPMFITGGYHFAACYRYQKFRFRVSVINGGDYDAEPAGINNSSPEFKRYYKTSPGVFFGYNIWRNLEAYTYVELHTFQIEQKSTGVKKDIHSTDFGGGISYQFFIGRYFYVQPGFHIYLRSNKNVDFNDAKYCIPNMDLSPVIRVGYRFWSKY